MEEAEAAAAGEAKANKKTMISASETGRFGNIEKMPEPIHGVYYKLFRFPIVHDPGYRRTPDDKAAVAVVGGGVTICVSAAAATYAFDTVGDWVLPFHGEATHVPELGLWLGLSACSGSGSASRHNVCAVDLFTVDMGSPPVAKHVGLDLVVDTSENWSVTDQTLVNLGSWFCVAKFYDVLDQKDGHDGHRMVVVFTGAEMVAAGGDVGQLQNGERRVRTIKAQDQVPRLRLHPLSTELTNYNYFWIGSRRPQELF